MQKGFVPLVAALSVLACSERDRLTFPPDNNGVGPVTFIEQPARGDTVVRAGPGARISGRTIDDDGVDTLYIELVGANEHFQPILDDRDTVNFGFTVNTAGLAGQTVLVLVFGTDRLGNRGDTAIRSIAITP